MKPILKFSCRLVLVFQTIALLFTSASGQNLADLEFKGHYRKRPKTSIVRNKTTKEISNPKQYNGLLDLIAELPSDAFMRAQYPNLNKKTSGFPNKRETEELRNVEVVCWIHAIKFEGGQHGDNDFHVVVGSSTDRATAGFLNVEISGLPHSGKNVAPLKEARHKLLDLFPNQHFTSGFDSIVPPLKVRIRGSLFFDGDHKAGCSSCPGPSYAKPETVWEIHPVYFLESVAN